MKRLVISTLALAVVAMVGGCSIAGTWKAVKVTPEEAEAHFPMYTVTFDEDDTYSATRTVEGETQTSTGSYEWDGSNLAITPKEGTTRNYRGYLSLLDGKLHLSHESEKHGKMKAVMEKQAVE